MRCYIQKQLFREQNINGTERESLLRNITPTSALDMGNHLEYRHCIHLYIFLYCHPYDPGDEISRWRIRQSSVVFILYSSYQLRQINKDVENIGSETDRVRLSMLTQFFFNFRRIRRFQSIQITIN